MVQAEFVRTYKLTVEEEDKSGGALSALRNMLNKENKEPKVFRTPSLTPFFPDRSLPSLETNPIDIVVDNRFLDKKAQTRGPLEMIEADVFERVKGESVLAYGHIWNDCISSSVTSSRHDSVLP